jgi:hypothetical protein
MAIMTLTSPGPSTARIAIASRIAGNAKSMSMTRMTTSSTQRPVEAGDEPEGDPGGQRDADAHQPRRAATRGRRRAPG